MPSINMVVSAPFEFLRMQILYTCDNESPAGLFPRGGAVSRGDAERGTRRWNDLSEPRRDAWFGLLQTHADITRRIDAELRARAGLTLGEYDVLVQLSNGPDGGMRMHELARAVVLSPSGLTRRVARLEQQGLVERLSENARIVRSRLTRAGRAALAAAAPVNLEVVQARFLEQLDESEAAMLAALWARLRAARPDG
jgi:DNA-binding MarR family transcriptional regulator